MHLSCVFYLSRPTFAEATLDSLQAVIQESLAEWSSDLRVAEDEYDQVWCRVGRTGRLYDALQQVAAPRRGLGDAVLHGTDDHVAFFLSHNQTTLPPELNNVRVDVYGRTSTEMQPTAAWARKYFELTVEHLPVRYANARTRGEFAAKNLIEDETGCEAVGVLLSESLPGLYWLNYFGRPYVELMGAERLCAAPGDDVKEVGEGVLIALAQSPEAWQSESYRKCEHAVRAHLGEQYFFARNNPERRTVAPAFR